MLAIMAKAPDLALDEDEAKRVAKAFLDAKRHYGGADVISPKTADTIRLCMVLGSVYGPRVVAIRADRINARASKREAVVERAASASDPEPAATNGLFRTDYTDAYA